MTRKQTALVCGLCLVAVLVAASLTWARRDARRTLLEQRLHGLSLVILVYRDGEADYPPDLATLEAWQDGSALASHGLDYFDVGEQRVRYVIPDSGDPHEALLYHWPSYKGGTALLYQNKQVDWVRVADGTLVNPRTGDVLVWPGQVE
jgi:type II secretory pathway pseudopilin PulG